jgi:Phage tail tube protein, GTA-gp10
MERRANASRGEVVLKLGGRDFVLRPNFTAIVAVEARLGGVVSLAIKASKGEIGLGETTTLLWETLDKTGEPAMTEQTLGAMILEEGLAEVAPVVSALLASVLKGSRQSA